MRLILFVTLMFVGQVVTAQEKIDTIQQDTVHSFKRAMLYSAILPGAGQVYNHIAMPKGKKKAYWKVPLIYAGLGATGYFAYTNNRTKKDLKTEYEFRQKENAINQFPEYDDQGLLSLYSTYRTRRDLCLIGFGVVYLLQIVDAGVEAHFVNFDIKDDLSLSIEPRMLSYNSFGVGLTLNFH
jgi:hypothetical protein